MVELKAHTDKAEGKGAENFQHAGLAAKLASENIGKADHKFGMPNTAEQLLPGLTLVDDKQGGGKQLGDYGKNQPLNGDKDIDGKPKAGGKDTPLNGDKDIDGKPKAGGKDTPLNGDKDIDGKPKAGGKDTPYAPLTSNPFGPVDSNKPIDGNGNPDRAIETMKKVAEQMGKNNPIDGEALRRALETNNPFKPIQQFDKQPVFSDKGTTDWEGIRRAIGPRYMDNSGH